MRARLSSPFLPVRLLLRLLLAMVIGRMPSLGAALPGNQALRLPTLWLIGDFTIKNSTKGLEDWGKSIAGMFDAVQVRVENRTLGGRSSRTFRREGLWEKVRKELKPGDFVIMQFGHNDGGPMDEGRGRALIKGNGDESKEITIKESGVKETVHSYGWHLRAYIMEAK